MKKWRSRITNGEFVVFTKEKPSGERVTTLDALYAYLGEINKSKFPDSLESAYTVLPTMYTPSSLKLGVECGAKENTRQGFSSSNPAMKLENALAGAWGVPNYWEEHPNLLISRIKLHVQDIITQGFESSGRISMRAIYEALKGTPYGFMPCNLSAFILGFVLKEYADGSYSWSDGLTNDALNLDKLKEMVAEVINLQITPNSRYKDKYIVAMTDDEKAFNKGTSVAFGISQSLCTSVEQTRERIRNKMKEYAFPIWTVKYILGGASVKTDRDILSSLIDLYCGIANSNNLAGMRTDNDIALAIGKLCREHSDAEEDLHALFSKDNCTAGMDAYLKIYENGELIRLAEEIGDNGQYINALRRKFNADAANWVWNVETAQQKIQEVILEYKIISESNKVISRTMAFDDMVREWCDKCSYIRISYAAAKNYLDELGPFLEMLHSVKKAGSMLDSQRQRFLELLSAHMETFRGFYNNQVDLFKRVCSYYVEEFTDDEVRELYQTIPAGTFTYEKSDYINLVDSKVKEYKSTLGSQRLKKLWTDKTETASPRVWSNLHKMPILCLVPDQEIQTARDAFSAVNKSRADSATIEKAIAYLESASFFVLIDDTDALNKAFRDKVIKSYSVMLTDIDEVKEYLNSRIAAEPYDWFGLPEVEKRLQQMAEAKYNQGGCDRALEKIDRMDIADVKRYLKELIKDNMVVGMEIIKGE